MMSSFFDAFNEGLSVLPGLLGTVCAASVVALTLIFVGGSVFLLSALFTVFLERLRYRVRHGCWEEF